MTHDEAVTLASDLERAGHKVIRIEPRPHHDGHWQIYAWCDDPAHFYWATDDKLFRDTVRAGLMVGLPKGALDRR